MKDSGIPWIGEIPEGWEIHLIGRNIKEVQNINTECVESNALQFQMGSIIPKSRGNSKYTPETLASYNIVDRGDIMINGLNLSFDFISQRIGQVKERGVITSAYLAVRPDDTFSSDYLTYLLKSYDNCKALHGMGKGLRQTLLYKEFRRYCVIVPSLAEQEAIAAFLDRKCGEVDEMVSLQEQVIEELKAYKQSVITEAVTKGLNPSAPMKPSNIDWIGQIPTHWEINRMKYLINGYKAGPFGSSLITGNLLHEGSVLVYTPEHVAIGNVNSNKNLYLPEDRTEKMSQFFVKAGDIVFPIVGSLGRAMIIQQDMPRGIINQRLAKFTINRYLLNERFFMWIYGKSEFYNSYIDVNCRGSIIVNLTKTLIGDMPVPLPPLSEQREIADYLDRKCADIDALIALKQQKIEDLKQYKKSLIYEYVTGKKTVSH